MTDLETLAARMVGIGFSGTALTPEARELIGRGVSSVIFFSRNIEDARQFKELTAEVKRAGDHRPIMTCVDQEGGKVQRLRDEPFTRVPSMRQVGQAGDEQLAYEVGRILSRELRAVNVDVNLAPVMDVDTNVCNPVISSRSFGDSPELVARLGAAIVRGLQDGGTGACAKHFPGHGDTDNDSHFDLPELPSHGMDRLLETELPPFLAAVEAGVCAVMTAHVIYPQVDAKYPATLSRRIVDGILRQRLGFDGLIMSDDMQMKAIADHYGFDEALVLGANAGVDLFWISHSHALQQRAIEVLTRAAEAGQIERSRLEEASRRLDGVLSRYVRPPLRTPLNGAVGAPEHRAIVAKIEKLAGAATMADAEDPTEALARQQSR